jgi:hypothetical protein
VKLVDRLISSLVVGALAVTVLATELPKLLVPVAVIFGMAIIGRLVWYWTQRW